MSCNTREGAVPAISFYHWKTNLHLGSYETTALEENNCRKLYVRYFDVDKVDGVIKPVAVVNFETLPSLEIIPVIFIREYVFVNMTVQGTDTLLAHVYRLITAINKANHITVKEIQFDCDWTKRTKANYFNFLKRFKQSYGYKVSSTIRLHQVKYAESMGFPPVDKGVLMFYNMGKIGPDTNNSIYDERTASRYISYLDEYPLKLDLALPIFGWNIQLRDDKVEELLNKTITTQDLSDTSFVSLQGQFYRVKRDGFRKGFYFKMNDHVKSEYVTGNQLLEIAEGLGKSMQKPVEIIFYDLDSVNLKQYDKQIFKKISHSFN